MKKLLLILLSIICIASMLIFSACNDGEDPSSSSSSSSSSESESSSSEPTHTCVFGEWITIDNPTFTNNGLKERYCQFAGCSEKESESIPKLVAAFIITLKDGDTVTEIPLLADGKYTLPTKSKVGYQFLGFETEAGVAFSAQGTVTESITVIAKYSILPTTTFAELKERIEGGADKIYLKANISLTDTIFVVDETLIYSDESYTLTRDAAFLGDLFILGCDSKGFNVTLNHKKAILTIKPEGEGTITIDGNKSNITGDVNGTVFFVKNSSKVNIYDNVSIVNCKKTANKYLLEDDHNISSPELVGGPVAIIANGAFNMYGGLISECEADLDDSSVIASEDQTTGYNYSSRGGAIFNYGEFNMYGGKIEKCKAGRGGMLYNYRVANLVGGEISNNYTSSYGGVMYQPDSQYVYSVIGDDTDDGEMLFAGNSSGKSGGVAYVAHMSVMYAKRSAKFYQNESASNGGAINCAGSLVVDGATFEENVASSKGGAVYVYYDKAGYTTRIIELNSGVFKNNEAPRGGAIGLGAGDGVSNGAHVRVGNVQFISNNAPVGTKYGYGGAIHVDSASLLEIYGSATFDSNTSADNGGAIYATKQSTVNITAASGVTVLFDGNTSGANGGVIYNSGSSVTAKALAGGKVEFKNNSAEACGGVFAVHSDGTNYLYAVTATLNSAGESGGVLYVYGGHAIIGDSENPTKSVFSQNSAESGGAVYISSTKSASVDAKIYDLELLNNTSTGTGGALCARVYSDSYTDLSCDVEINKLVANGNSAGGNGGALHIYTFANVTINTLTANENTATGKYGGAIYVSGKANLEIDSISATDNEAAMGGCIYLTTGATVLTINGGDIRGNTATDENGGNALWSNSASSVFKVKTNAGGDYLLTFNEGDVLGKSGFAITPYEEATV